MSNSGDFQDHISKVTDTVRDLSSWILRSFKSRSPTLMLQLWKSIVIPHLDYCSQLWNPHKVSAIQQLEELQKSFVRHISGFRHMNYWTALAKLGLYSLQRRRERYQIIYLWSILESKVPNIQFAYGNHSLSNRLEKGPHDSHSTCQEIELLNPSLPFSSYLWSKIV